MSASSIRALQPNDLSQVAWILDRTHADAKFPLGPRWTPEQVAEECRGLGYVLIEEAKPVAFVLFRKVDAVSEITFLATAPDARGRGLMSALIHHMISELPQFGQIWLEVHERNESARKFYEKMRFKVVGQRPRYYSDGGSAILYNYG